MKNQDKQSDLAACDNTLFVTGRCNNRCLMCCQPPVEREEGDELLDGCRRLVEGAPCDLPQIAITGGEPTLLDGRLFDLIALIRHTLPRTEIQLLSNGRAFASEPFARRLAQVASDPRFIYVGVPLHSDYGGDHDGVTGVRGSFDETLQGLYNLALCEIPVELRVVVQASNYRRLPRMADFIFRYLPFVSSVAFMALEDRGWCRKNPSKVWVEPQQYMPLLRQAVLTLAGWQMEVKLFNYPLCLLPADLHPFACRSISPWKVRYLPLCEGCSLRAGCGGLFATSHRLFQGVEKKG